MVTSHIQHGFPGQVMLVVPRPVIADALNRKWPVRLMPSDIGYFPMAAGHHVKRSGGAPEMIVILCVKGSGWAEVGELTLRVLTGQMLIIPPGLPHAYGADLHDPWSIYWCHASGPDAADFASQIIGSDHSLLQSVHDVMRVVAMFEEIQSELSHGYSAAQLCLASSALIHLLGVLYVQKQDVTAHTSDSHERLLQVISTMHQNWRGKVKLSQLAEQCHLSMSHFCELFRGRTGFPPLDYFLRIKIQRACELLATTHLPIKQISKEVGIQDPLYFSRMFSRIQGMPPSIFRQNMRIAKIANL